MWPREADDFEPDHLEEEGDDSGDALYFAFKGDQLICKNNSGMPEPVTGDDFRWFDVEVQSKHFLGRYQGNASYALGVKGDIPEGYGLTGLRGILGKTSMPTFYLAGRALQIVEWHNTNQYCGQCGEPTDSHPQDRAKLCNKCGLIAYPRLSPSIIVLVTKGEEMLLARNAAWPAGMFSTLAGFVEAGESIEQTVHREVFEEVGLKVRNLRYFGSQSWPFPNSLMLGFHAEYDSGDILCQPDEIAEAKWFNKNNLPQTPPKTAISGWLIEEFINPADI